MAPELRPAPGDGSALGDPVVGDVTVGDDELADVDVCDEIGMPVVVASRRAAITWKDTLLSSSSERLTQHKAAGSFIFSKVIRTDPLPATPVTLLKVNSSILGWPPPTTQYPYTVTDVAGVMKVVLRVSEL